MKKLLGCTLAVVLAFGAWYAVLPTGQTQAADAADHLLSHDVFFSLKDASPEARKKLVEACKKYLSKHPGTVAFSVGVLAEDLKREVNDRDFDVALHVLFKNREAHDKYQEAALHKQFIEENKDNWKKVRVFDSVVEQ